MALTEWLRQRIENSYITTDNSWRVTTGAGLDISIGNISGVSYYHKFGVSPDFDTADNVITIWDGADDGGIDIMNYVYSATADIDSLSSSNNGDTQDIEVQGLDSNFNLLVQTLTLTGQTRVALPIPLIRVFRIKNEGTTDFAGLVYCYVNTAIVTGVPVDKSKIRAIVDDGNNQTLMAIYTIPNGKTGYMRGWYASTAGSSKTSQYIIDLYARKFNGVFQLKHRSSISDIATSYVHHNYDEPEMFLEKTDIEMRAQATAVGASGCTVAAGFDIVLVDN